MGSGKGSLGGREWLLLERVERWGCHSHDTESSSKAVVAGCRGRSMHLASKGLGLGSQEGHLPWCHVCPVSEQVGSLPGDPPDRHSVGIPPGTPSSLSQRPPHCFLPPRPPCSQLPRAQCSSWEALPAPRPRLERPARGKEDGRGECCKPTGLGRWLPHQHTVCL